MKISNKTVIRLSVITVAVLLLPLTIGVWIPDIIIPLRHSLAHVETPSGHRFDVIQYWNYSDFYNTELRHVDTKGNTERYMLDGDDSKSWSVPISVDEVKKEVAVVLGGNRTKIIKYGAKYIVANEVSSGKIEDPCRAETPADTNAVPPAAGQLIGFVGQAINTPDFVAFAAQYRLLEDRDKNDKTQGTFRCPQFTYWFKFSSNTVTYLEIFAGNFRNSLPLKLVRSDTQNDVKAKLGEPDDEDILVDAGYDAQFLYLNKYQEYEIRVRFMRKKLSSVCFLSRPVFEKLSQAEVSGSPSAITNATGTAGK